MNRSFLAAGFVVVSLVSQALANETAYKAIKSACASQGKDAFNRVMEVSGTNGVPQPEAWRVSIADPKAQGGLVQVEVRNGKIVGRKGASARPGASPIFLNSLKLDSDGVFDLVNREAVTAGISYDRIHYTLSAGNQAGLPTWSVEIFDGPHQKVGSMKVAGDNALILERSPELAASEDEKRARRWSKPGEPVRSVPDGFHRFGLFSRSVGFKLKNWVNGYGWTDDPNPPIPKEKP